MSDPNRGWAGRTVLVTGASRGVGRAVAEAADRRGARVALAARSLGDLERVAAELTGPSHAVAVDVADAAGVARMVEEVEAALGSVDILVNNAGIGHWAPVTATSIEDFRRLVEVNYLGAVHATKAVLDGMVARGSGHVVNVASVAGRLAAPYEAAYSASKFALVGFSEALAVELTGTGVHVALIDPGPVAGTKYFEARGRPSQGGRPRQVPVERVVEAVITAVERDRAEQFVPRWLGVAAAIGAVAPPLHRFGLRRRYRREIRGRRGLDGRFP